MWRDVIFSGRDDAQIENKTVQYAANVANGVAQPLDILIFVFFYLQFFIFKILVSK